MEGKDQIDNFIQRFERYARANLWRKENWAISLGALLTGKALEAYTRLSEEDAVNYEELKNFLLDFLPLYFCLFKSVFLFMNY